MDYTICVAKTKALISCAVTVADLLLCSCLCKIQVVSWCSSIYGAIFFYLVKVLIGFNCVWRFIRVVLLVHEGSGCQSNIKADCLNLLSRPAPVMTIVEILWKAVHGHLFHKRISRFVSLKINDLGIYRTITLYKLPEK